MLATIVRSLNKRKSECAPAAKPRCLPIGWLQLTETAVIECMEKLTTAWRPEGEWISKLDLVEEGDRLAVKEMGQVSRPGVRCSL
jgi:hypothetical protein